MPNSANFFATSATQLSDGDYAWINLSNMNSVTEQSPDNTKPQTTTTLSAGKSSNTVVFTDFNVTYPLGYNITGYQFFITKDSIPIDADEALNVTDFEVYIYKNGSATGSNLAGGYDWSYHTESYGSPTSFVIPVTKEEFESSNFGLSIKAKNSTINAGIKPVFYSVYLNFTYTTSHPVFIYNNDTTSEISITLDLNPEVTNPTTEFGIFHGDADTTSSGTNQSYTWGGVIGGSLGYFTEPNLNDPSGDGYAAYPYGYDFGQYNTKNYLSTPYIISTLYDHSISYHTLSYDTSDLVVGETYRRALVLFNVRFPLGNGKPYDYLYVNIDVIDSSIIPETGPPKFLYNGDTTSEVNVTIDLNTAISHPTTTFYIDHGNDTDLLATYPDYTLSYTEYNLYTDTDSTSADEVYNSEYPSLGTGIGIYPNNYLSTPQVTIVRGVNSEWGSDTTTSHTMSYNYNSLVAGNDYRRGLVLWYKVTDTSGAIIDAGIYDVLYFNLHVIDSTVPELIQPYLIYNGYTDTEVNIIVDKNPDVVNPTTIFSVFHGDVIEPVGVNDIVNYNIGTYFTTPNLNDPDSSSFTAHPEFDNLDSVGTYSENYLILDTSGGIEWDENSGIYESHTITDHIVEYDVTNLVAGQTYRRGLALAYFDTHVNPDVTTLRTQLYDILYFNIQVIDSSIIVPPKRKNSGTYSNFIV